MQGIPTQLGHVALRMRDLDRAALPADAPGPGANRVGMYHMAWEMASFDDLERFHARLLANAAHITGYSDRQMNVMFLDPDGNERRVR